jgi:GTPase SAR1 family protein
MIEYLWDTNLTDDFEMIKKDALYYFLSNLEDVRKLNDRLELSKFFYYTVMGIALAYSSELKTFEQLLKEIKIKHGLS